MIDQATKWCNGPCGRELPAADFYRLQTRLSSFCRRCDNIRRVDAFKATYRKAKPRARYLKAQRDRRHQRQTEALAA